MAKKKAEKKEVALVEKQEVSPFQVNPEVLIAQAITQGVPVETMERLLAMRKELKAEWAKEQYDLAMANFQSECPIIEKKKVVKDNDGKALYSYAPLEVIVAQVRELVKDNKFSYAIKTETKDKSVISTCVVKHSSGHSEEYPVEVPYGTKTRAMSDSQVTASALTFAKRYSFCNAFGILTGDEDNDGADLKVAPPKSPVKTPIKELEDRAIKAIEAAKTPTDAIKVDDWVSKKKDFSATFKKKIKGLASTKVDELENQDGKN